MVYRQQDDATHALPCEADWLTMALLTLSQMQKRSEHEKLRKFIKLIELMIRNALHEQVVSSAEDILSFLTRLRKVRFHAPCAICQATQCTHAHAPGIREVHMLGYVTTRWPPPPLGRGHRGAKHADQRHWRGRGRGGGGGGGRRGGNEEARQGGGITSPQTANCGTALPPLLTQKW